MNTDICQLSQELISRAAAQGFHSAVIPAADLVFVHSYRKYCADNLCGNYNCNYSCPPYCGVPEEMEAKTKSFQYAWILESSHVVKNALDPVETGALKKQHNQNSRKLMKSCKEELLSGATLAIMAGPCNLCSPCHMPAGEPCPFEDQRTSCLSAYCIDVGKLAESAHLPISWSLEQASFYSLLLF